MVTTGTLMTAEEFDHLPVEEGRNHELIEGELVEMSSATPKHNYIQTIMTIVVSTRAEETGGAVWPTTEFALGESRCQPDLAIFVDGRWKAWDIEKIPVGISPDIAVEIISPSESATRVDEKIQIYLDHGVNEVWTLFATTKPHLYVHERGSVRRLDLEQSLTTPLLPELSVPLRRIFSICL